jgi:hypothetical protein
MVNLVEDLERRRRVRGELRVLWCCLNILRKYGRGVREYFKNKPRPDGENGRYL